MIKRNLFKKNKIRAEPSESDKKGIETEVSDQLLTAWICGEVINKELAMSIPSLAGCINKIADTIASIPVKLYKKNGDTITEIVDDNRTILLNCETGDTLDGNQFKKAMVKDYFLGKGAYAYINKIGNKIVSIHYVDEQNVSFVEGTDHVFKDYYIIVQSQKYYPHEFIRFLRNSKDGIKGIGLLNESKKIFNVAFNSLKFEQNLVATGGNKKGFVKSSKRLTQEAIDNLKEAWSRLYNNNSENVVILNDGLDFKESSNTSVEMQLNENKKTNGDEICKIMGTPPPMLNGNASENDEKNFIKYGLSNVLSDFETALNRSMLLEDEKESMFFSFYIDELTKGDIEKRYAAYKIASEIGVMQGDEIRKKENMPPIGLDFIKLGLQDGLYDPTSKQVYVLNTNKAFNLEDMKQKEGGN